MTGLAVYGLALGVLNLLMATQAWGSAYLSAIILLTYAVFRPTRVLHPNNMLLAFYGLYVVLSSTLNLALHLIGWDYVLPGGQQVFWNEISLAVLFQAEVTFLVLFFGFRHFCPDVDGDAQPPKEAAVNKRAILLLSALNVLLVFWFLQSTAGIWNWITDYSYTYLARREGHGLLNVVNITLGNALVFVLGVWTLRSPSKVLPVLLSVIAIGLQAYVNGFKGRFIFLLLMYFSPYLMDLRLRWSTLIGLSAGFVVLLYVTTLVRTQGYYAAPPYFLEMLIGYFNAHQLHDWVVTSREPGLLQTMGQLFTKPLQVMGLAHPDADFDLSVMLTKEFFPLHWELEKATQQWPLDTELYLNWYGPWLGWVPLLAYALFIGALYRTSLLRRNLWLLPVFMLEFNRIFSALRGTLIPWEVFILIVQYPLIYFLARWCLPERPAAAGNPLVPVVEPRHA